MHLLDLRHEKFFMFKDIQKNTKVKCNMTISYRVSAKSFGYRIYRFSTYLCFVCVALVIVGYELNVNNLINPTGFDVLVVVGLLGFGCFCMTHSNRRYRKITPGTPDPFENQTPTPLPRSMQKVIAKHSPPKITPISSLPAAGSPIKLVGSRQLGHGPEPTPVSLAPERKVSRVRVHYPGGMGKMS